MQIVDKLKKGQFKPTELKVTDKDVYIHPKLKKDLEGVIKNITNPAVFGTEMGYRGILLIGAPGTGKTLTAQYIAKKSNALFYNTSGISNAEQISALYQYSRNKREKDKRPIIIFFDEIDRFSSREDIVDPSQGATLNQLLMQLDGIESNYGITTIGISNKPKKIDTALRRPKRFGKEIEFLPPDERGRLHILKIHAYEKDHKFKIKEEDLIDIAKVTFGYTGADLVGLLNEAFTNANLEDRIDIKSEDLKYALTKTKPSALRDMPFKEPKIKLDDLGGYELHKELLRRIIKNTEQSLLLFYGPEGTGKTVFAEAIAGEYGFNFIVVSGSEPTDKYVGETGKTIDKYLDRAKQLAPSILLFDEIDALVEQKGVISHKASWTGLLQSKLSQPIDGVYIIATLNRPDLLKTNFLSRFIDKLYFGMPSKEEQIKIWQTYVGNDIDAEKLAEANSKLSGRDIAHAYTIAKNYGLPETKETYLHLIEEVKSSDDIEHYGKIRQQIGDSVQTYEKVKSLINKEK